MLLVSKEACNNQYSLIIVVTSTCCFTACAVRGIHDGLSLVKADRHQHSCKYVAPSIRGWMPGCFCSTAQYQHILHFLYSLLASSDPLGALRLCKQRPRAMRASFERTAVLRIKVNAKGMLKSSKGDFLQQDTHLGS